MRNVNGDMAPEITTVFLMPPREIAEVSSSFVKGLVGPAGWERAVEGYLPRAVHRMLRGRLDEEPS
jgi:pantetheine-phosphate adenylyltransferase